MRHDNTMEVLFVSSRRYNYMAQVERMKEFRQPKCKYTGKLDEVLKFPETKTLFESGLEDQELNKEAVWEDVRIEQCY